MSVSHELLKLAQGLLGTARLRTEIAELTRAQDHANDSDSRLVVLLPILLRFRV